MGLSDWEQFVQTGRVEDYLLYKSSVKSSQPSRTGKERAEVDTGEGDNHSDRDGAAGGAHWRV